MSAVDLAAFPGNSCRQRLLLLPFIFNESCPKTKRAVIGGIIDYVLSEKAEAGKDKCVWSPALNSIAGTRKGQRVGMISP